MADFNSNAQCMEDMIEGKQKKTAPKYVGIIIALVLLAACSFGAILPGMTKGIQQAMMRAMMLVMVTATMQDMMMALQESSAVRKISLMLIN